LYFGFWQASLNIGACGSVSDYFFTQPIFISTLTDPKEWVAACVFRLRRLSLAGFPQGTAEALLRRVSNRGQEWNSSMS